MNKSEGMVRGGGGGGGGGRGKRKIDKKVVRAVSPARFRQSGGVRGGGRQEPRSRRFRIITV